MAVSQHRTGARKRPCFVCALLVAAVLAPDANAGARTAAPARGRIAPPAQAACSSGSLTSYFGRVIGYKREAARTWLKIATDYGTVEALSVPPGAKHFLYRGRAFVEADWARIESKPGVLRPGTRATAWVCEGGGQAPLIDWNGVVE
jgi:hypothetical protein